ncbi:MAG: hypothetical protein HQL98_05140 [Magnetococcales bacterium]|nr:hypothetical protein [Magnetococcales bacterium]
MDMKAPQYIGFSSCETSLYSPFNRDTLQKLRENLIPPSPEKENWNYETDPALIQLSNTIIKTVNTEVFNNCISQALSVAKCKTYPFEETGSLFNEIGEEKIAKNTGWTTLKKLCYNVKLVDIFPDMEVYFGLQWYFGNEYEYNKIRIWTEIPLWPQSTTERISNTRKNISAIVASCSNTLGTICKSIEKNVKEAIQSCFKTRNIEDKTYEFESVHTIKVHTFCCSPETQFPGFQKEYSSAPITELMNQPYGLEHMHIIFELMKKSDAWKGILKDQELPTSQSEGKAFIKKMIKEYSKNHLRAKRTNQEASKNLGIADQIMKDFQNITPTLRQGYLPLDLKISISPNSLSTTNSKKPYKTLAFTIGSLIPARKTMEYFSIVPDSKKTKKTHAQRKKHLYKYKDIKIFPELLGSIGVTSQHEKYI